MRSRVGVAAAVILVTLGGVLNQSAQASTSASIVGTAGSGYGAMAVDSTGRLFAMDGANIKIYSSPSNLSSPTTCSVTLAAGATEAGGMSIDSSGRIYLSFGNQNKVLIYSNPLTSCTAAPLQTITTASNPKGVVVDSSGALWIGNNGANSVQRFTTPVTAPTLAATYSIPGGAYALAFDGVKYIYTTTSNFSEVHRADITAGSIVFSNLGLMGLNSPLGITAQPDGLIQVVNNGAATVKQYDTSASGSTNPTETVNLGSISGGFGAFFIVGPVSSNFFVNFYGGQLASISGLGAAPPVTGDPIQAPAPILQQLPANADGTCAGISDAAFAYGTGLTGGWHGAWAQWVNSGHGGLVCSRTMIFDSTANRWTIAA